ncbi:2-phosphosulfolactate phosphatase [Actinoplanes sp. NPDC048796]|uniref:2-phosphosulfolactate phosphatase n=1 Tax=Actinoplanes sp. NPDC048796 TaxID=3155640 RepID=UPI0033C0D7AE
MSIVGRDAEVTPGTVVVVIDVIRAFTTAAVAFERGAAEIVCVASADAGRELRRAWPDRLLIGEVGGLKPADFDYGNSPLEMSAARVEGRGLIQATTNGTRGLVRHPHAAALLAASAVNVAATARWIAGNHPGTPWTLVCTGRGAEDRACATYLDGLLRGTDPSRADLIAGIGAGAAEHGHVAGEDLPFCTDVDRSDFAMVGRVRSGRVTLSAVPG